MAGSVYGTTAYLASAADLEALERHLVHNLPLLDEFSGVLVATNYGGEAPGEFAAAAHALWRRHLPACVLLDSPLNRGHSIGTADLDNLLFDHCKARGIRRLCKSASDVLLDPPVLDLEVHGADFYFLNAVSYDAIAERGLDLSAFTDPAFLFPQTTFYVIDVEKSDHLVGRDFLDRSWAVVDRIPGYNGRIWEYIPQWSCELLLRKCVQRNGLTRCHLMDDDTFAQVLRLIVELRLSDCSLKNVRVNGICHIHEDEQPWPVVDVGRAGEEAVSARRRAAPTPR